MGLLTLFHTVSLPLHLRFLTQPSSTFKCLLCIHNNRLKLELRVARITLAVFLQVNCLVSVPVSSLLSCFILTVGLLGCVLRVHFTQCACGISSLKVDTESHRYLRLHYNIASTMGDSPSSYQLYGDQHGGSLFPKMGELDASVDRSTVATSSKTDLRNSSDQSLENLQAIFPHISTGDDGGIPPYQSQEHAFDSVFDTSSDLHSVESCAIDDHEPRGNPDSPGGDQPNIDDDVSFFPKEEAYVANDVGSLDSSVLHSLSEKIDMPNKAYIRAEERKFPFLARYIESYKQKHPTDDSSVFGISGLDDFQKFSKKSEINDAIERSIAQERFDNTLPVMENHDLEENFYSVQSPENKTTYFKEPWQSRIRWFGDRENRYATHEELDELRAAGGSISSSSGLPLRESNFLQRKLKVRHLQMISFGGTLGVGLFLNSGKAFTIAGGLGTVLAFAFIGLIVLATITSFSEMVTFVSVVDGVSGLSSRFVEESFGFATGWLYFLSFSVGLAGEIVASVIILSYFPDSKVLGNAGATAGFVTLFLSFCIISNLLDVRVFGEIEYVSSIIKVIITLIMIIAMIVINRGGLGSLGVLGFKYWDHLQSIFDHNLIFGPFRPTFNPKNTGTDSLTEGIGGSWGRLLSLVAAMTVVIYAYSGTEIVCIAACEAKNPRKALPSATKRVFWRILLFYCLASFVVSLNIYAGDPRLLRYYTGTSGVSSTEYDTNYAILFFGGINCKSEYQVVSGYSNGSQSPWTVAFQSAGLCNWSSFATGSLVFFAFSCGNSQLYVLSRTIYSLALQNKAPAFLKNCNRFGIPYNAVLAASMIGFSSYMCVSQLATRVFQTLTSLTSSTGSIVWFSMCVSYVRFYFGLKRRPDIVSRDDKAYPYRSPFQPYTAIFGLLGSGTMILLMGFVVFIQGYWDTLFFFSSYGSLILFLILYLSYKFVKGTRVLSLEALDFDSGRREADIFVWDGGKEFNKRSTKAWMQKIAHFIA